MALKILYLHHYPVLGGASRSLLEMIQSFTREEVEPRVLTPRGQFAGLLRKDGIQVLESAGISLFDNTRYGHYRGWRWLILLREIAMLPVTFVSMLKARRAWADVDIVHVNEATMLVSVLLARWLFRRPVIVHVRSVMKSGNDWGDCLLKWVLWRVASQVVAIDESVRRSLPANRSVEVIHNGLRIPRRLAPPDALAEGAARNRPFTVAMVGTLLRVKGCLDFVEAAALCKQRGLPIEFVFIGQSARRIEGMVFRLAKMFAVSQEIEPELHARIAAYGLEGTVRFAGFCADLESVYRSMDVVCFPSHFDAPGRPIFEAAMFAVPSVAAISEPLPDTIIDGVTGLTVTPRQPAMLADALQRLYEDGGLRAELGRNAHDFAVARFESRVNAEKMLRVYRGIAQPANGIRSDGQARGNVG